MGEDGEPIEGEEAPEGEGAEGEAPSDGEGGREDTGGGE